MPKPADAGASLESRAKAYLDTNCSVCHRPQGLTPVNTDLRHDTALSQMNIVGVAGAGAGHFGHGHARDQPAARLEQQHPSKRGVASKV
jgi:hypothetical protein